MMRSARFIAFSVLLSILLYSCFRPEEFDEVPRIFYQNLEYKEAAGNIPDSLILTLDFQDGDGDIGLQEFENTPPVHGFDFIIDANNRFVTLNGTGYEPPFDRAFLDSGPSGLILRVPDEIFSGTDNRPATFNCQDYVVDSIDAIYGAPFPPYRLDILELSCLNASEANPCVIRDTLVDASGNLRFETKLDTFYITKNEQNRNIFVDFYRKVNGEYQIIDWASAFSDIGCGPDFNARFPVFSPERIGNSLEGTIRYGMQSNGFQLVLRNDTFKIEARIKDRNLNTSNTVSSPDLTLSQIGG